jgi:hypothetical protein
MLAQDGPRILALLFLALSLDFVQVSFLVRILKRISVRRYSLSIAPFEITKVARQLSTELVKNKSGGPVNKTDEEIRRSYYKKSSTATALALIKNRGPLGLYTGFRYHVGK